MINIKCVALVIISLMNYSLLYSQTDCNDLKKYRDGKFYSMFSKEFDQYNFNKEQLEVFKSLKLELESENWFITNGAAELTLAITGVLNTTCDLILDLIPVIPSQSGGEISKEIILQTLDQGKNINSVIKDGLLYTILKEAAKKIHPITQTANAFHSLYSNLSNTVTSIEEASNTKRKMLSLLSSLEKDIKRYEKEVRESYATIMLLNNIKTTIDDYCN